MFRRHPARHPQGPGQGPRGTHDGPAPWPYSRHAPTKAGILPAPGTAGSSSKSWSRSQTRSAGPRQWSARPPRRRQTRAQPERPTASRAIDEGSHMPQGAVRSADSARPQRPRGAPARPSPRRGRRCHRHPGNRAAHRAIGPGRAGRTPGWVLAVKRRSDRQKGSTSSATGPAPRGRFPGPASRPATPRSGRRSDRYIHPAQK